MNRLDRLTSILIQLQGKRVVRAQEIADRFGISLRTVYRDVRSLEAAGVPIIGEAGIGYALAEGYRLPPIQFNAEEASAFLTAEKLVNQFTDAGLSTQYQSGMAKVRAVLRLNEKDVVDQLDSAVRVMGNTPTNDQTLAVLLQAISQKEVVSMEYTGQKDEAPQRRSIEPMGVFYRNEAWYVVAWCRLREDVRNFRVDRMRAVRRTGGFFSEHNFSLEEYLEEIEVQSAYLEAAVTVPNEIMPYIDRQKQQFGFISQRTGDGKTAMQFRTVSYEYLARWAMQFADRVIALSPPELEQRFAEILAEAKKNFNT